MKGYKGFDKGMICRGKQYAENTVFEEDSAVICESGMHFCERPIDVLRFYSPTNANGELNDFAEVEAIDEAKTDDNVKYCTKKLKVGAKIGLLGLINAEVEYINKKIVPSEEKIKKLKKDRSAAVTSGFMSAAVNSGDRSAAVTSGFMSAAVTSGDRSAAVTSGFMSAAVNSGDRSAAVNSGDRSAAVTSGDSGAAEVSEKESIAISLGVDGRAKGNKGCWLTIAEWGESKNGEMHRKDVKTVKVDGERIKENTWYALKGGKFVEVE